MYITLAVLVVSAALFMQGKIRSDLVALCALVVLLVAQVLTPEEGLSGFSNNIVIMMVGLFVVGGGIFQTGLAKMVSGKLLKLAGKSELKLTILIMLVTAATGAFVSNTGTVALMMPIVVSLAAGAGMNASRLLMPLAFASSMGVFTLISTPPNLIIDSTLRNAGYAGLEFFDFAPVGLVCLAVGMAITIPLSKKFLSKKENNDSKAGKHKTLADLANEYQLSSNLFRVKVLPKSAAEGKSIIDLAIRTNYNLTVLEIRRDSASQSRFMKSVNQDIAVNSPLEAGDILYLTGGFDDISRFATDGGLSIISSKQAETSKKGRRGADTMDFYEIGIAEILIMPTSTIINKTVKESEFRDKYSVNVLGIRRKNEYILNGIKDEKIYSGDVLLVQGRWSDIGRLGNEDNEWVVLGQPLEEAAKVTLDYKAPVAALIMALMVAMMVVDAIPVAPVTAVMIAAILMVVTGCLKNVEAAYKTINWESIVLIAAMLPMSLALEKTGASEIISNSLVSGLGRFGPTALLAGIYFTTSLLTMFISNTATAVLMSTIALQAALGIGADPTPFMFAVAIGASMCFASPFSTPPNALVMPAGQYTFMDYVKVGMPLQITMGVVMVFVLPLFFPF